MKRDATSLPDLTFPTVEFGERETPWDLSVLLYKAAAAVNSRYVHDRIASGKHGKPKLDRLELVQAIHAEINGKLVGGGSWLLIRPQYT